MDKIGATSLEFAVHEIASNIHIYIKLFVKVYIITFAATLSVIIII